MTGPAAAGGFDYQAEIVALVSTHILGHVPLSWFPNECSGSPVRVEVETGMGGDDLCVFLSDDYRVEVQVKKGLRAHDRLWGALDPIVIAIQSDPKTLGALVVDSTCSATIRMDLARDIQRLGQGRSDQLHRLSLELLRRLEALAIPPEPGIFRRLRIITIDPAQAHALGCMHLRETPFRASRLPEAAWDVLCRDGHRAAREAGAQDHEGLTRLLLQRLERTADDGFWTGLVVGREPVQLFLRDAWRQEGEKPIIALSGEGGVGKTTLLEQFCRGVKLAAPETPVVRVNALTAHSRADWVRAIVAALPAAATKASKQRSISSTESNPRTVEAVLSDDQAPISSEDLDRRETIAVLEEVCVVLRERSSAAAPAVIAVDNVENAVAETLDERLRELVGLVGLTDALFVLAGRSIPRLPSIRFDRRTLRELLPKEADRYLRLRGERDGSRLGASPELRTSVILHVGRLPMFLELAADVFAEDLSLDLETFEAHAQPRTRRALVSQFLIPRYVKRLLQRGPTGLPSNEAGLVECLVALAIPRWLTDELAAVLGHGPALQSLVRYASWVRPAQIASRRAYVLQDRIRELLLTLAAEEPSETLEGIHSRCAEWAARCMATDGPVLDLVLTHQYHLFHVRPDLAQRYFEAAFKQPSDDHDISLCRLLVANIPFEQIPPSRTRVWLLLRVGDVFRIQREFERAEHVYENALREMASAGDNHALLQASLLNNLGIVLVSGTQDRKRIRRGLAKLDLAITLARAERLAQIRAFVHCNRGIAWLNLAATSRGGTGRAQRRRAIEELRHTGRVCRDTIRALRREHVEDPDHRAITKLRLTKAQAWQNLASVYVAQGQRSQAVRVLNLAIGEFQALGYRTSLVMATNFLATLKPNLVGDWMKLHQGSARILAERGDYEMAAAQLLPAIRRCSEAADPQQWAELVAVCMDLLLRASWTQHEQFVRAVVADLFRVAEEQREKSLERLKALLRAVRSCGLSDRVPALPRLLGTTVWEGLCRPGLDG